MSTLNVGSVYFDNSYMASAMGAKHSLVLDDGEDLEGIDLLVFWGGEDIWPGIYGEKPNGAHSMKYSVRDHVESTIMRRAIKCKIPILGVCRGAQLACAITGGKLWQDVDGHVGNHRMETKDGRVLSTNSLHHQMMRPASHHEVLAEVVQPLSKRKRNAAGEFEIHDPEPEVVWDPENKALMVQGHPEYSPMHSDLTKYTRELLWTLMGLR
jgi:putative glutamine amidotransferase